MMDPLGPQSIPRLPRGVRLSHDQARERWLLLAPERIFEPNDIALVVLRLVDGERSIQAICEELGRSYNADPALIMADVAELLGGLVQKRLIET
jgi:pyrroloquinoline quinone biosynthesis protein D